MRTSCLMIGLGCILAVPVVILLEHVVAVLSPFGVLQ